MSKGVLYCMTTAVPSLIKIGKTTLENYDSRMYALEKNGYSNVVGLKRNFAIEVDDYDEKEILLDNIFNKSRVPGTELFALDINLVVQLMSSLEGRQIYPEVETKEEVFKNASVSWCKSYSYDLRNIKAYHVRIDESSPFYNKKVVFTGKLEKMNRIGAAQIVVNMGGKCLNSVTKELDILIVGGMDVSFIKDGKSIKLRKVEKINEAGGNVKIISENDFYEMIRNWLI